MLSLRKARGALAAALCSICFSIPAWAQHEMHAGHAPDSMRMEGPLGIPMDRMGSGTSWIPDAVRLPSRHFSAGRWDFMQHGFAFLQQDWQGGPRGDTQFGSLNWVMLMASRSIKGGLLQPRTMLSI